MKSSHNQLNKNNSLRRKLVTGGVIASGIVAAVVQPAKAEMAPTPNGGAEAKVVHVSKAEMKRNHRAQSAMDTLARRILNGKVNQQGNYSIFKDQAGDKFMYTGVIVHANSLYSQNFGEYQFSVVTKLDAQGRPILKNVQHVAMIQGETTAPNNVIDKPYSSIGFIQNTDGNVLFSGSYMSPKDSTNTNIEAGVVPTRKDEAHLTDDRLTASIAQANAVIDSAIQQQPIGALEPAFIQPANTSIIALK